MGDQDDLCARRRDLVELRQQRHLADEGEPRLGFIQQVEALGVEALLHDVQHRLAVGQAVQIHPGVVAVVASGHREWDSARRK